MLPSYRLICAEDYVLMEEQWKVRKAKKDDQGHLTTKR